MKMSGHLAVFSSFLLLCALLQGGPAKPDAKKPAQK
jgi:hypothetical protein